MSNNKVQDLSICGLRYARFLGERIDVRALEAERDSYRYIEVYSYMPLEAAGFALFRIQKTPVIDLAQSLDEIFGRFHTLTRRGIRRSEELPDLTVRIPDSDESGSYRFYKKVKKKDGVIPDLGREFQRCLFMNAYYKNRMIASISFYDNGRALRCKHIVSLRKEMGEESNVAAFAARRLVWEVCRYGKERGYAKVDLGGINFEDPAKRGVAQFKSSFGGDIRDVYVYRHETSLFALLKRALNWFGRNIH